MQTFGREIIYLVDDDQDDRMLLGQALRQLIDKINIIEFSDGNAFLDSVIGRQQLDQTLVLMDLNMPRMSGLEVISALQADLYCKDLPVLVVSTVNDPLLIQSVIASGALKYYSKPDSLQELNYLAESIRDFYNDLFHPAK